MVIAEIKNLKENSRENVFPRRRVGSCVCWAASKTPTWITLRRINSVQLGEFPQCLSVYRHKRRHFTATSNIQRSRNAFISRTSLSLSFIFGFKVPLLKISLFLEPRSHSSANLSWRCLQLQEKCLPRSEMCLSISPSAPLSSLLHLPFLEMIHCTISTGFVFGCSEAFTVH